MSDQQKTGLGLGFLGIPTAEQHVTPTPKVERRSPTATTETLVCTVGPCKHYADLLLQVDESNRPEERVLKRYCRALATAAELMELTEACIFACSYYEPPAQHWGEETIKSRMEKNRTDLEEARRVIGERK